MQQPAPGPRSAFAADTKPIPLERGSLPAVERGIRLARRALLARQEPSGAWRYAMEGSSVLPDAHFLLAHRLFNLVRPSVERKIVDRLLSRQLPNGGWPLYPGHEGHLSATVEAYYALRLRGMGPKSHPLSRAREFIQDRGGLSNVSSLTRVTLAATGQLPWDAVPLLPIEVLLLPRKSPFNLYSIVSFTRVHLVSIMTLGELRYQHPIRLGIARELNGGPRRARWKASAIAMEALARVGKYVDKARRVLSPSAFRTRALLSAKEYLISHQEPDGTWGNYILSTFFGILAMRALGYAPDSPEISRAYMGLRSLVWDRDGELFVQPCNSAIWSTALVSYCLRETGVPRGHEALRAAARWLLDRQSFREGDWKVGCPDGPVGTWGFQEGNALFPDVDDTIAAVRAILPTAGRGDAMTLGACALGEQWAVAMQNDDGGWSSFDRNCRSWWLERIPFNDMVRAMTDPSTADMTGRMLEFLGLRGWRVGQPEVDAAVESLRKQQEEDGSWFGRWGIAYLYGSWAALLGLGAVRVDPEDPMVRRGVAWLEAVQNEDGGWGESCASDTAGEYVSLGRSVPSQSAWGLMGLLAVATRPTPAIRRGIEYLLRVQELDGSWTESYTTGAGFAGKLYLDYRFYKDIWPLQALGLARNLMTAGSAWAGLACSDDVPRASLTEDPRRG